MASSYSRPSECGSDWEKSGSSTPCAIDPGQMAVPLTAPVEHQHRGIASEWGRQRGRRGVSDVVPNVTQLGRIEPGQRGGQELARPLGVGVAQVIPGIVQTQLLRRQLQRGIEGIA